MADPNHTQGGKKTIQIGVKMREVDYRLIQRAAAVLWPNAILSNSAILLGLAMMRARQALATHRPTHAP